MNSAKTNKPRSIDPDPFGSFLISSVLWGMAFIFVGAASFFGYKYFNKYITTDPPGYCRAQDRYIPDEEFLETAVTLFEWDMNRAINNYRSGEVYVRKDRYAGKRIYDKWLLVRDKPECCAVIRDRTYPLYNRMFDRQDVEVQLNYKGYRGGGTSVPFNVCGKILPNDGRYLQGFTTQNYQNIIDKYSNRID